MRAIARISIFFGFCPPATGKMPVPQKVNFPAFFSPATGKMPVPQKVNFLVGWAGDPAHKRIIENGARCKI